MCDVYHVNIICWHKHINTGGFIIDFPQSFVLQKQWYKHIAKAYSRSQHKDANTLQNFYVFRRSILFLFPFTESKFCPQISAKLFRCKVVNSKTCHTCTRGSSFALNCDPISSPLPLLLRHSSRLNSFFSFKILTQVRGWEFDVSPARKRERELRRDCPMQPHCQCPSASEWVCHSCPCESGSHPHSLMFLTLLTHPPPSLPL